MFKCSAKNLSYKKITIFIRVRTHYIPNLKIFLLHTIYSSSSAHSLSILNLQRMEAIVRIFMLFVFKTASAEAQMRDGRSWSTARKLSVRSKRLACLH